MVQEEDNIEKLLQDDSFVRFLKGKAAKSEQERWLEWLEKDPLHHSLLDQALFMVSMTERPQHVIPDPQVELKKFHSQTSAYGYQNRSNRQQSSYNTSRSRKGYRWTLAATTVLIAGISGLFFLMMNSSPMPAGEEGMQIITNSEHQTAYGERAYLHLPDGSRIVLNANSYLSYSKSSDAAEGSADVEVILEGEALFDITPSESEAIQRTFSVRTKHGDVDVTGTLFWVETTSDYTRTILEEGEIRVSKASLNGEETASELTLKPGDMARFSQSNDLIEVKQVNTKIYTSWITNVWTFDQTSVEEIALRIGKVFGKEVVILSDGLKDKTLSGTISSDNLGLIMEGLSMVLQEKVTESDDIIYIGTE